MAQVIGDYELIERIGAGGMGEVWRAQNIHTHVGCAVKLLPSEATADRTFVARFFDEGRLMQTLDHPRIVRVHHVGHDTPSGRHFLVMDFVAGPSGKACSLHDLLEQSPDRRLPEADVRRWATQVAEALSYAHEQGVVHRDIKPANVLVDRDNNARVADFGLAKAVGEEWLQSQIHASVARSMGNTKTVMPKNRVERSMGDEKTGGSDRPSGPRSSGDALLGTYDYMAPEQRGDLDAPISPATDIYAFGVMLYRLLTGRRPTGMTKPVSQVVPGLSKEWDTLISRCLEHDPKERYANGAALLEALDGLGRGTRGSSKVREFGSSKVKDSKTWLWLVGAAVIAVVSILSIWSMQSSRAKRDVMHLEPPANTSEPKEDQAFRNATVGNVLGMAFVDVSPGSFEMGSNSGKVFEKPVRTVRITKPFWMGKCEVTQREYRQLMGANPSRFVGDDLPVEKVTWDDAVKFCEDLTRLERAAGRLPAGYVYRLPTEAEWEYAAGGGQRSQGFTYSGGNEINAVAWHGENSDMKTQPVGGKQANALGLHDMSGNVYEWCHDWWQDGYGGLSTTDPTGPLNGSSRICRGGTYFWHASHCRIASRNCCVSSGTYESIGIRVVLGPVLNEKKIVPEEVKMLAPVDGQDWTSPETGMKFVWVPALKLWVGKYEVTNGEYRKKDPAHDSKAYEGNSLNGERQPVVQVNFDDAKTYAAWLTERDMNKLGGLRYRLPSEAEWLSFAQCGDNREYPWGSTMPPKYGNYSDSEAKSILGFPGIDGYTDGYAVSSPVEQSGKNDWGLYGVGGNVWECCAADVSGSSFGAWRGASWDYYPDVRRVWSGASWNYIPDYLRCAFRGGSGGSSSNHRYGFRLVLSRPAAENEKKRKQQEEDARIADEKQKQEALAAEQERLKAEAKKVADDRKRLEDEKAALAEASRIERERKAKEEQERINKEKKAAGPKEGEVWVSPTTDMEFVWIPALKIWVGKYEVTNGEYRKKEAAHDSKDYEGQSLNGERQPVVYVNFDDANEYAAWLAERDKDKLGGLRYRLPSEAEWLAFAQCGDGREYPWGSSMPPKYGNYCGQETKGIAGSMIDNYTDGYVVTCPVEKSGRNDWGLCGVGGNVWEICAADAAGASFGAWRGASWYRTRLSDLRCACRRVRVESDRDFNSGFRLVLSRSNQSCENEIPRCVSLVRNALYEAWEQPKQSEGGSRPAKLYIRLDASGRVINYRITQSSGSTIFDTSVLKAAANCPPVRGLTADFLKKYDELTIEFRLE